MMKSRENIPTMDAFISYRRKPSASLALLIQEKLKTYHEIDVYVDTTRTDSTQVQFPERLMNAIADAPVFVCLLGEETLQSEWVLKEIDRAHSLNKRCIPVFQESYVPLPGATEAVEYLLSFDGIHVLDVKNIFVDESVRQLSQLIKPPVKLHPRRAPSYLRIAGIFLSLVIGLFILSFLVRPNQNPTPLDLALEIANSGVGSNAEWQALYPSGFVHEFGDGVAMVLVPVGCFEMGNDVKANNGSESGGHICFDDPFWIDQTEVTQTDFVRLGGKANAESHFPGPNRPVEQITWFEAVDFCEIRGARLPTEAEWEYAARGPYSLLYPWGNEWNSNNAIWNRSNELGTAAVGSLPKGASWVGAMDMSGNIWEWTSTIYDNSVFSREFPYPYNRLDGREETNRQNVLRVLRGGSSNNTDSDDLRAATRGGSEPTENGSGLGFRCVQPL